MSIPGDRLKMFEGILSSQSFDLLRHFRHDASWEGLLPEEKEVLAQLFLLSAENESQSPISRSEFSLPAVESYRCACRLLPNSARSWYRLGVYLAFQENVEALQEARGSLVKAIELDAGFFDAQHALASVSLRLGVLLNDEESLRAADDSFVKAVSLISTPSPQLYWHWGLARFLLAQHSGEPNDFLLALRLYEKADELGMQSADFFGDTAHASIELGLLVSNSNYISKAIDLFRRALDVTDVSLTKERALRYYQLGCCFQHLYDHSREEEALEQAFLAFSQAVLLDEKYMLVYQKWGHLLFKAGMLLDKKPMLEEALEKFKKAEECGSCHPVTFALGALSLLYLAEGSDRIEILNVANQLSYRAERLAKETGEFFPEVFAALALSQVHLGEYFSDESYLTRASNIVREGLLKLPNSPLLWHVLAIARTKQAQATDDEQSLKDALVSFFIAARSTYAHIPSLWTDWGTSLLLLGEWIESKDAIIEAIAKFEMARKLGCEVTPVWILSLARMYDTLSTFLDDESCCMQAIELLETIVENVPDCMPAICQLGVCHMHLGQLSEEENRFTTALSFMEQYLEIENEDDMIWLEYANALIHRGFFSKDSCPIPQDWFAAEEALLKALYLGNDAAHYHLATLYALFGDSAESILHLYRGLEKGSLPPLNDIREDDWLVSLQSTAVFQEFARKVEELYPDDVYPFNLST